MACFGAPPTAAVEQRSSTMAKNLECIGERSPSFTWHTHNNASVLNTDLAKMPATLLKLERLDDFCEGIRHVNHRTQVHRVQGSDHLKLMSPAAHCDAVQRLLSPHQGDSGNLARDPCQDSDQHNVTTNPRRFHGLRQR